MPGPVLYLDSSDISHRAEARDLWWASMYGDLRRATEAAAVEPRFSAVHVSEARHLTPEAKPLAIARARVVKSLCGTRCLTYWTNLVAEEGLTVVRGAPPPGRSAALRDDGIRIAVPVGLGRFA